MAEITNDKATICLWYDGEAEAAAHFYAETFGGTNLSIQHAPADYPDGRKGQVILATLDMLGMSFLLLNGGDQFKPNEAFSVQIHTDTQEETDRLWNAVIADGGAESACGWCKDPWGHNWQITPRALTRALANPDRAAAGRAMEAMMTMRKIDIAAIEAALAG